MKGDPLDRGLPSCRQGVAVSTRHDAVTTAMLAVDDLSSRLDMSVGLAVWGNLGPTMVRWADSTRPVAVSIRAGLLLPLLRSATGLIFAAHLPRPWPESPPLFATASGVAAAWSEGGDDVDALLSHTRSRGIAAVSGNILPGVNDVGINAASSPVFGASGVIISAVTVMAPSSDFDPGQDSYVTGLLSDVTRRLSASIGRLGGADAERCH